ncbi:IclR family transcriptional regulator, partial [Enterococcus faecalis]|nr:IclR family transcriptional regulator [Enterococcus faecalis]
EQGALGISEIAKLSGLAKTTVFRILKTLEYHGIVMQIEDDIYTLSYKILKYQPEPLNEQQLIKIAKPCMQNFSQKTGETINLSILHRDETYIIHSESGESYMLQSSLAPVTDLYCSSIGKIFLSEMSTTELERYYQKPLLKRTINTIINYSDFYEEQQKIKEKQISFDHEEYEYGLTCMATGIYQNSELIAALGCSGPTTRLSFKGIAQLENELKKSAKIINQLLEV